MLRGLSCGGRKGDNPVAGGLRGRARAAARRAPEVLRRSCQSGDCAFLRARSTSADMPIATAPATERSRALDGARRALRALEDVEKVLTRLLAGIAKERARLLLLVRGSNG